MESRTSIELFALRAVHLTAIVRVLIGHCVRLKPFRDVNCSSFVEEGKMETSRHFLRGCSIFTKLRSINIRCPTFIQLDKLLGFEISHFKSFATYSKNIDYRLRFWFPAWLDPCLRIFFSPRVAVPVLCPGPKLIYLI